MSGQGSSFHGSRHKSGEKGRWRERALTQTPYPVRGEGVHTRLPGDTSISFLKGPSTASSESHPWKVSPAGSGKYTVAPGTIGSVEASIEPVYSGGSGVLRFYWEIEIEPGVQDFGTEEASDYWLQGYTILSVNVTTDGGETEVATVDRASGTTTNGLYVIHFATAINNQVVYNRRFNLVGGLCVGNANATTVEGNFVAQLPEDMLEFEFVAPGEGLCTTCCGAICIAPFIESESSGNYGEVAGESFDNGSGDYEGPGDFAERTFADEDNFEAKNYRWRVKRPTTGCSGTLMVYEFNESAEVVSTQEIQVSTNDPAGAGEWSEIIGSEIPPPEEYDPEVGYIVRRYVESDWIPS